MDTNLETALHALYVAKAKCLVRLTQRADKYTEIYTAGDLCIQEYDHQMEEFAKALDALNQLFSEINNTMRAFLEVNTTVRAKYQQTTGA
jgi:hypothetical protein